MDEGPDQVLSASIGMTQKPDMIPSGVAHFRAFARRPVTLSATLVAGDGSFRRAGRVVDLGLGGACVLIQEALPVGSPVALEIDAPHLWDPLELDAMVAWAGEEPATPGLIRLGVRFLPRSGAVLRTLTELLEATAFG
jgi:hypothetical protein